MHFDAGNLSQNCKLQINVQSQRKLFQLFDHSKCYKLFFIFQINLNVDRSQRVILVAKAICCSSANPFFKNISQFKPDKKNFHQIHGKKLQQDIPLSKSLKLAKKLFPLFNVLIHSASIPPSPVPDWSVFKRGKRSKSNVYLDGTLFHRPDPDWSVFRSHTDTCDEDQVGGWRIVRVLY